MYFFSFGLIFPFPGALKNFSESRFYYDTAKGENFESMQHPDFVPTYGPLPVTDPTGEQLCKGTNGTINQFCYDDYIMSDENADLANKTLFSFQNYQDLQKQIGKLLKSFGFCCSTMRQNLIAPPCTSLHLIMPHLRIAPYYTSSFCPIMPHSSSLCLIIALHLIMCHCISLHNIPPHYASLCLVI